MSSTSNFRKRLDALIQNGNAIKKSAETTLAWRSLQMAKAWLGKALGYQGNASPYTVASKISEIPPTADTASEPFALHLDNHLGNVNLMRDQIQSEIESIEGVMPVEERQCHCYQKCLDNLVEARMWYGFELAEIREKAMESRNFVNPIPSELAQRPATVGESINVKQPEFSDEELEAIIPINPKISENENEGSKEKQQGTPKKKG